MARYSVQIDWLSLVFPCSPMGEGSELTHNSAQIERVLHNEIGEGISNSIFSRLHVLDYGRAPYTCGWKDDSRGVTIWAGGASPHFTVEFSGKGVHYLRENQIDTLIMERTARFLSRIDIAIDLEQGVTPEEFLKYRKGGRQLTHANMSSPAGNTCYVGSMHSERYMRVYRYNAPHPRSHLLRLEMVARRAYAKQAGLAVLEAGLDAVAKQMLEDFGFGGLVDFDEATPEVDLTVFRPERNMGKTLNWLLKSAAPAFHRLVREGTIPDAENFLRAYFLSPLDEQDELK